MAIEEFKFYPVDGFKNEASFPNPATEQATREQLQRLHGQTRDKLNEVISVFNSLTFPTDEHIIELIKGYSPAGVGKVVASDCNYAEVYLWADGNPSQDDRLNRFVTLGADGISIASSDSATIGVSVQKADVGFIGGYADGDENDSSKAIVSIIGVAHVKTNDNSIVANDFVMSDANGYAIKSTNNLGYRVLKVISSGLLEIVVSPNTDMVQRIRTDMVSVEADVEELKNNVGMSYDLLWTNVTDTAIWTNQTIELDLSSYKAISLIAGQNLTEGDSHNDMHSILIPVPFAKHRFTDFGNTGSNNAYYTVTTTSFTAEDVAKPLKPLLIYGIK